MKKITLALLMLSMMIFAGHVEDGIAAYKAGDLKKAFGFFQKAADEGNAWAQNNIGVMYENGKGVGVDLKKAVEYYQKAVAQGSHLAQCNLGLLYMNGKGVAKDLKKAAELLKKSADQGNKWAKENLDKLCKANPEACK